MSTPNDARVVLIRYDGSPFAHKMTAVMAYLGMPYYTYNLPNTWGGREEMDKIGLVERRTPKLIIGSEVIFDSHAQLKALQDRKLFKEGRELDVYSAPALYAENFVETQIFVSAVKLLPDRNFTPGFIADRLKYFGMFGDLDAFRSGRTEGLDRLQTLLKELEVLCSRTSQDKPYLFEQAKPTILDFSMWGHFWLASIGHDADFLVPASPYDKGHSSLYPALSKYLQFMQNKVEEFQRENPPQRVLAKEELGAFMAASPVPAWPTSAQFNDVRKDKERLGKEVSITSRDVKTCPQRCILKYLDADLIGLEVHVPDSTQVYRVWAPRRYYDFLDTGLVSTILNLGS